MQTTTEINTENESNESLWIKTPVANLVRYKPSGVYYVRARIKGSLFRQSLKTNVLEVAKLKLADFIRDKRRSLPGRVVGKMFFRDAVRIFKERLESNSGIKQSSKQYRLNCLDLLLRTWPELNDKLIAKITQSDCEEWAIKRFDRMKPDRKDPSKFSKEGYSPTVFNNTCDTLRMILDVAVESGVRSDNPASWVKRKKVVQKKLELPSKEEFEQLVDAIHNAGGWCSKDCADFVRFLAYGGFRKGEAALITWAECDFEKEQIHVYAGEDGTATKNGKSRFVPMIEDMKKLLLRMKSERPNSQLTDGVALVHECESALTRAADEIGIERITHHDLRHLFATRCIESGVDIPTVSRWLGHQDGGALAMRVYGHLRDEHSSAMAKKVSFSSATPANVVALEPQQQRAL